MKEEFINKKQKMKCVFTDEGVTFSSPDQEFFFPYGAIDTVEMSFLGVVQVTHRAIICNFAVEREEKARMKEMIRYAKQTMKTAEAAEPRQIVFSRSRDEGSITKEELLKRLKTEFIQGRISHDEYEARKRQLK